MIPGGPATALLGMEATPEAIADLNAELGFDRPFFVQYADWFINMLHGDWTVLATCHRADAIEHFCLQLSAWLFSRSLYLWLSLTPWEFWLHIDGEPALT